MKRKGKKITGVLLGKLYSEYGYGPVRPEWLLERLAERCTFWKGEKRADENWATYVLTKNLSTKYLSSHVQFWTENSGLGQIEIVFGWSNSPNC